MWTVTIRDTGVKDEAITAQVEYTNGDESIVRNFMGNTQAEIDRRIGDYLTMLETRDAEKDKVKPGVWTPPVVEEVEVEKTADELAADAWLEKWNEFVAAEKAMDALKRNGITPIPEEEVAFNALKDWVAENRKPQYAHLIANTI